MQYEGVTSQRIPAWILFDKLLRKPRQNKSPATTNRLFLIRKTPKGFLRKTQRLLLYILTIASQDSRQLGQNLPRLIPRCPQRRPSP